MRMKVTAGPRASTRSRRDGTESRNASSTSTKTSSRTRLVDMYNKSAEKGRNL